jgi:putative nucleotidyltransferase with HDIG domain
LLFWDIGRFEALLFRLLHFVFFIIPPNIWTEHKLWNHTLACAITSEVLSRKFHVEEGSPFEAGLLHDIGKVVFDYLDPELFQETVKEARAKALPLNKVEPHYFGADHSEVGTLLANHWNLPEVIVQSIHYHHNPEKTPPEFIHLTCLVALSNALTYSIEMGDSVRQTVPELPPFVFETLKIKNTFIEDFKEELHTTVEKGIEAFSTF